MASIEREMRLVILLVGLIIIKISECAAFLVYKTSKNRFQASLQGILYWMFVSKTFNAKSLLSGSVFSLRGQRALKRAVTVTASSPIHEQC